MTKSTFNPSIHGLRGAAALSVFIFHIYDMSRKLGVLPESLPLPAKMALLSLSGGVDVFFMISGFLITGSLVRHQNVRAFLADRVLRIYPVFLVLHLGLFTLAPIIKYKWLANISATQWIISFVENLFLLPGIFKLPLMQLNAWSLSFEFAFYFFSSVVYVLWGKQRLVARLVLIIGIPAVIVMYPRTVFFGIGSFVFVLLRDPKARRVEALPSVGLLSLLPFVGILGYSFATETPYTVWCACPFGLAMFFDIARRSRPFSSFLEHRIVQFFGTISYSFYLWHPVVTFPLKLLVVRIVIGRLGISAPVAIALFVVTALALTVPVSLLSYTLIELKLTMWLKRQVGRHVSRKYHRDVLQLSNSVP